MWKTVHLISSALSPLTFIEVFGSAKNVPQPKRTPSYNRGPFLCPGEAAVRQLQAAHRALPVSDEEHASGFPLHQRRCHYTLRAHAEVKSHRHRIASRTSPLPAVEPGTRSAHSPRETHEHFSGFSLWPRQGGSGPVYLCHCSLLIPSTNHLFQAPIFFFLNLKLGHIFRSFRPTITCITTCTIMENHFTRLNPVIHINMGSSLHVSGNRHSQ